MTIQNIIYNNTGVVLEKNEMRSLISADVSKLRGVGGMLCIRCNAINVTTQTILLFK